MAASRHDKQSIQGAEDVKVGTDHSLLRRFQEGEQDAATALYLRYAKRLQALAKKQTAQSLSPRFDSEDVVQSVFRTFFRRASEGCYEVPVGEELWQLLLVLALNKIRTLAVYHRAQKRDASRTVGSADLGEGVAEGVTQDSLPYETMRMLVQDLIATLPAPQDRMLQLRIEGHEIAEIASLTSRSKRTVERTLQNFRQHLNKLIDEG